MSKKETVARKLSFSVLSVSSNNNNDNNRRRASAMFGGSAGGKNLKKVSFIEDREEVKRMRTFRETM